MPTKPKSPDQADHSSLPPHPDPKDPKHDEWIVDEADEESFPASDPSAATQPKPTRDRKK